MNPTKEEFSKLQTELTNLQKSFADLMDLYLNHAHLGIAYDQSKFIPNTPIPLVDQAEIECNAATGDHFYVTLGGDRTLANPRNLRDGQKIIFEIIQDGTGSRLLTLDSKFTFGATLTSITLSTAPGAHDFIGCKYNLKDDKLFVVAFQDGYM